MATRERAVLGLLADPEVPAELARRLADELPGLLARRLGDGRAWEIRVLAERLPVVDNDYSELRNVARARRQRQQWDYVICITDSPLYRDGEPLVADIIAGERIAVVSLPAFGGVLIREQLREVLVEVVADLTGESPRPAEGGGLAQGGQWSGRRELPGKFRHVKPRGEGVDDRILVSRNNLRLLFGMVWANQPWRLVFGLTRALAAALAAGAYVLVTPTIWQLADSLGSTRLILATVFSVTIMVAWLILDHHLWVKESDAIPREEVRLYNSSTVLTLVLGVLCAYVGLFTISFLVVGFLIDDDFFRAQLGHPVGWRDYLEVAWFSASLSVLAGALGSGFDSEESARRAAYGRRERERRAILRKLSEQSTT